MGTFNVYKHGVLRLCSTDWKFSLSLPRISDNFDLRFVILQLRFSWSSVLGLKNLKIHKTKAMKSTCIHVQEKCILWLTFNPGLA